MKLWLLLAALLVISPAFAALSATASVSPRYVDTFVINQTFVYTIYPTSTDDINRTVIFAPEGYEVVALQDVTVGTGNDSCLTTSCLERTVNSSEISINFTSIINNTFNNPLRVTFLANTSSSYKNGNFTSLVVNSGGQASTTQNSTNSMNVTTRQIINVTNVEMLKGTALLNGSDYWEFKFTVAYTASQAGHVQLRMNNWVDNNGYTIPLYSGSSYYATLRNESTFNTTGKFNITSTYAGGINNTVTAFYLRMLIPLGTTPSNTWSSSYNFLFRATP